MKDIVNFIRYILPNFYYQFILFIVFTLMVIILETFSVAMIIPALNLIVNDGSEIFSGKANFLLSIIDKIQFLPKELMILFSIFFAFVIKNIFLIFYNIWQSFFVLNIEKFLANNLFKSYLKRNMMFFLENHSGTLLRNITVEVKNVTKSISSFLTLIIEIFLLFVFIFALLYISTIATIISVFILGFFGFLIIFFSNNKINFLSKIRAAIDKQYNKNLIDTFNSINDIKLLDKIKFFFQIHKSIKEKYILNSKKFAIINSIPRPFMELLFISLIVFYIFYSINSEKDLTSTFATLGLFSVAAIRMFPAVSRIIVSFQSLKFRYFSFRILLDEFKMHSKEYEEVNLLKNNNSNILFNDNILFKNISFNYKDKKIIDELNLEIKKGQLFFIHGLSGSGKTTILNLLMGLLKPNKGEILVDGKDINDNILKWRNMVSYVPQNIYLLDESIKQNIAFGEDLENIDEENLRKAIKLSRLDQFVKEKDIHNFQIGEKGSKISGGQIQRIGVARALYRNPKILLLDESTNGLDYETEREFLKDLTLIKKNTTIIFVSHREHIKEFADSVFEVKKN